MRKIRTDVLVIGTGVAGMRAAIATSNAGSDVLMIVKRTAGESGSTFTPVRGWVIQALTDTE